MNNTPLTLNANSMRATKARFASRLDGKMTITMLRAATALSLFGGAAIVVGLGISAGWLLCIPGFFTFMLVVWYQGELKNLPSTGEGTIDAMAEGAMLGRLPFDPSPQDIAKVMPQVTGGRFFALRFGIDLKVLIDNSSTNTADTPLIWQRAYEIMQTYQLPYLNSMCVAAALILTFPGNDRYLAQLRLDPEDILAGVGWQKHLQNVFDFHKERPLYGGIARDWAFGFTPLLERFAYNLTEHIQVQGMLARTIEGHQNVINQTMQVMTQGARRNATLIGGVGAGKTTLIRVFAERLINPDAAVPGELRYNQVIALDPSMLISQAQGRGELENLVQQMFVEAHKAKNIVLFLDDAQLFLEDGTGSVNLANILLPVLEGGALRIVLAMDEQRWLQLSQDNPGLVQLLNRVPIEPLNQEDTMLVMEDQLIMIEAQSKSVVLYQALREAYRLSERYIAEQVMPGRALKLLEAASRYGEQGFVTARSVQQAVEQSYGIKVGTADQTEERERLLNLEELIHQRMINQVRAVQVVSDALRRARAGVRNQTRPIGTFLFLGPTGVGKTELSKALAEVYFNGEDHLVRVDLNEYVQSQDLSRLIADGARDPHSLTAQIARQPFSVVLLDEIEKAHPDVLSALLQMLDEGILRDINNREVSFRDAIVIATSNAGAQQIREHIEKGESVEQFEEQFTNELINSGQFRPEFLNRFDEIVIFRPLKPEELLQVVDLIINSINATLEPQKVSVTLTSAAKELLVKEGYDPRLGARPLRRVVQRTVESIMAQRMLSGAVQPGDVVTLDQPDIITAVNRGSETPPPPAQPPTEGLPPNAPPPAV